jgi:uncharacterized transporter YbjL
MSQFSSSTNVSKLTSSNFNGAGFTVDPMTLKQGVNVDTSSLTRIEENSTERVTVNNSQISGKS